MITPDKVGADPLTACSVGVLAATTAAVAHETVGHGLGCLAAGGQVTLLTSIYFRCAGGTWITDAAGPLGGLAVGLISLALYRAGVGAGWARLFLLLSALVNLGWFAGQLVYCAVLNIDDWAFVARALHAPAVWRVGVVAAGVATYAWTSRRVRPAARRTAGMRFAALAAAASSGLAGLAWAGAPVRGALEGIAAVGLAPAVLLAPAFRPRPPPADGALRKGRSWAWVAAAAALYGLFLMTQGRGLGRLA